MDLPDAAAATPSVGGTTAATAFETSDFWVVDDMYRFDNVAFSRTVGGRKFLCCPDCEYGPMGFRSAEEPPPPATEEGVGGGLSLAAADDRSEGAPVVCYVAAARVAYALVGHPPRPNKNMDAAALAALTGGQLPSQIVAPEPESEPPSPQEPNGQTITARFTQQMLGLYLEERPEDADAAGVVPVVIGAFNEVQGGVGEAEASGLLQIGDEVLSVHGVGTES